MLGYSLKTSHTFCFAFMTEQQQRQERLKSLTVFHQRTRHKQLSHSPHSHRPGRGCKGCYHKTSPRRWSPGSGWPCHSCPGFGRARPLTGSSCRSCSVSPPRSATARKSSALRRWGYPLHPRKRAAGKI